MTWAPDYTTAANLKAFTYVSDTSDDTQVALAITSASRLVDDFTNRQFGQVASSEARYYRPTWDPRHASWFAEIDDLQDTTGLQVLADSAGDLTYASEITSTYYRLHPLNASAKGRPFTHLEILGRSPVTASPDLKISGLWGWSAVPSPIEQATLMQASRILQRRQAPFGVAGVNPEGLEIQPYSRLDVDVELSLKGYRRIWSIANGR